MVETLAARVSQLVERGDIDRGDPSYGVALAAIDLGYDGLTRAQKRLYDRVVAPALAALDAGAPPASQASPDADRTASWRPIREAPSDRDVELATLVDGKPSALAFPCRRTNRTWVNAATGKPVFVRPSHWRAWP